MSGLPSGWVEAPIGELCGLKNGRAFKPTDWTTSGVPIVRIQNLNNSEAKFNFYAGEVEDRFRLRGGELLFAWSGTPGTSFGAHVWNGGDAVLNQHIFRVDFDASKIDKRFFRFAINQKLDELIGIAHGGAGLQHVTKGKFEGTEIWLPPLPEQTRIADKLDALLARVDAARERLDRVPALLKRFRQSVLAAATSGALTEEWRGGAEAEWLEATFGDACESSFYGPRFGKDEYTNSEDGIPTVRTTDMTKDGRIEITNDTPRVAVPADKIEKFAAREGDLLVTRTGSIGVMAVFDGSYVAIPSAYLIRFRFKESILPRYAFFCLMAPTGQEAMGLSTTAITQPNINAESIKAISIALPSIDEQAEIIRRVEALFALADQVQARYDAARARVDKLTPALLAKAFRGELVPQDPNDEPASVLLERLRTSKASEATPAKRGRKPSTDAAKTRTAR